ncbi:hypothetical protein BSKO_00642 [Bryopsis sp. KO-2023]|nr:hypothetical protein BSKO_00642 [Bryopsis sp. KO-2023]
MNLYQPKLVEALLLDAKQLRGDHKAEKEEGSTSQESDGLLRHGSDVDTAIDRAAAQREVREKEKRQKEEDFRKATERKHMEHIRRKEERFQQMYQSVLKGLTYGEGITGEMQDVLDQTQKVKNKKQKQLFHDWETQVFERIQSRIKRGLDSRPYKEIEERLRSQYDAYIKTSNEKLAVFRDVIIEEDYDPLAAHKSTLCFRSNDIDDPCLQATNKTIREQQEMGIYDPALDKSIPGKVTFSTTMWDKVEATPYGHCMDTNGNYVLKPASEAERVNRKSNIHIDHYDVHKGRDVMMAECPKGRGPAEGLDTKRLRRGESMFDVVQQSKPCWGGADLGTGLKRMVPGPDAYQNRRGLTEILQQTGKIAQRQPGVKVQCIEIRFESHPIPERQEIMTVVLVQAGDIWLDSKGKRWLPGAEDRLNRRDLFEALHRGTINEAATVTGDIWIDRKGKRSLQSEKDHDMWAILKTPSPAVRPDVIWVGQQYMTNIEQSEVGLTGSA